MRNWVENKNKVTGAPPNDRCRLLKSLCASASLRVRCFVTDNHKV